MDSITAHMQHRQQRMCSVRADSVRGYYACVQPEQRIIADWIERTRNRLGWSYKKWAEKAGIGAATTLTRALKDDYQSVTSVKTLHDLARAAGERSILDFLAEQESGSTVPVPSEEALAGLLSAVLPLASRGRTTAQSLRVVAAALQHGLELLGDRSATDDAGALDVAARGAVSRFRDLTQQ